MDRLLYKINKYNKKIGGCINNCENMKYCGSNTNYAGLCVSDDVDCNSKYNPDIPKVPKLLFNEHEAEDKIKYEKSLSRYMETYLLSECMIYDSKIFNYEEEKLPNKIKIMTLNAMGLCRGDKCNDIKIIMKIRSEMIVDDILKNDPDIICFQEMSFEMLEFLSILLTYGYKQYPDLEK